MPRISQTAELPTACGAPPRSSVSADARAKRSAQSLREAMLALLETTPFDRITVRGICRAAGVHYATFFRHHQTKESLLDEVAKSEIQHLNGLAMAIRNADSYEAGFIALCSYVEEHRALWSVLLNGGAASVMREEWLRQAQAVAAIETPINHWLPSDLGTICAATLIAETLAWWVGQPQGTYSVGEVANILYRLLTASIMAPD